MTILGKSGIEGRELRIRVGKEDRFDGTGIL
jgi:hypothetical protein